MRPADYDMMRLRAAGNREELDRIMQLECRDRASHKLPETLMCESFRFPTRLSAEQCTSDELAREHALLVGENDTVLDMTCGLAIDALHIARKAASVTAVDLVSEIAEAARHNAAALGLDNLEVICGDSVEWLRGNDRRFDVIFIDPARRAADGSRLKLLSQCSPDVTSCLDLLKSRCRRLIIKASPMLDISGTLRELGHDTDIVVYGSAGECKELTAVLPGRGVITVRTPGMADFSFTLDEESRSSALYGLPQEGDYLFEPSAPAMKAGAFALMSERFGLFKPDVNTHLYFGKTPVVGFPGHSRRVVRLLPYSRHAARELADYLAGGVDVAVRNFPMTADALSKSLGVKRGGDGVRRLYGFRCGARKLIAYTLPASD